LNAVSRKWLNYHPIEALILRDLENVWTVLKIIYNGDFKNLVYGELPKEEAKAIFATSSPLAEQ
jgi:hypothetical protein